jgi:G3E family GTPase
VLQDFDLFNGVMRAKGCFWTTAEPGTRVDYSLVGNIANLVINTTWTDVGMAMLKQGLDDGRFADRRKSVEGALQRLNDNASRLKSEGLWRPITHDRRVDLVFIGDIQKMDEDRIRSAVQDAMLSEEEFEDFLAGRGPKPAEFANPFKAVPRCVKI